MKSNFVLTEGLITVEALANPAWLIRRRNEDSSMLSPFNWVATVVQLTPEELVLKGYLARSGKSMTKEDFEAMHRITRNLGYAYGSYERFDSRGNFRKFVRLESY